jgi:hypothetical protein
VSVAESFIGWSYEQALIGHQLSAAAYCGYKTYLTHQFNDPETDGFQVTRVIYNKFYDVEGFVGYLPSDEAIYVVFRGSDSTPNYLEDFAMLLVQYEDFGEECAGCKVSVGFQKTLKSVRDEIVEEVKRLSGDLPDYAVKLTGHSLGASWAQLMGMYLLS